MERSVKQNPVRPRQARFLSSFSAFTSGRNVNFACRVNCSLHLRDARRRGSRQGEPRVLYSPPPHNKIKIQAAVLSWKQKLLDTRGCARAPVTPPPDLWKCFHAPHGKTVFFWKGGLFVFEPALEEANNRLLQSKQFYQLMNRDLLFATRLFCVIIRQQLARKRGARRGES